MRLHSKIAWGVRIALLVTLAVLLYFRLQPKPGSVGFRLRLIASSCEVGCLEGICSNRSLVLHFAPTNTPMFNADLVPREEIARRLAKVYELRAEKIIYVEFPGEFTVEEAADYLDLISKAIRDVRIVLITPSGTKSQCGPPLLNEWIR